MGPSARAINFYHEHLGCHLAPDASPADSIAPSLPTRTKKSREALTKDPSASLDIRRIGTGMPVYYIVTEEQSWLLSNAEPPAGAPVNAVRIDDDEGKASISGTQYIAHWFYHEAPIDRPFLVGSIEKANPVPSLRLSTPPLQAHYCTTSGKTGTLTIHLQDYRDDIATVIASKIPWADIKKGLGLRQQIRKKNLSTGEMPTDRQHYQEDPLRKEFKKLQAKHAGFLSTLGKLHVMPASPNEKVMSWFFANDNVYGRK